MKNNINNIRKELLIQLQHPHIKTHIETDVIILVRNVIEDELFYQKNGTYPIAREEGSMPEELSERAIEIEERLLR